MKNKFVALFAATAFCAAGVVHSQAVDQTSSLNEFFAGKTLETDNVANGKVTLNFNKNGVVYGTNGSYRDSGKWSVEGDKLCLHWNKWEYDGCGIVKIDNNTITHYYPGSDEKVHFRAQISK